MRALLPPPVATASNSTNTPDVSDEARTAANRLLFSSVRGNNRKDVAVQCGCANSTNCPVGFALDLQRVPLAERPDLAGARVNLTVVAVARGEATELRPVNGSTTFTISALSHTFPDPPECDALAQCDACVSAQVNVDSLHVCGWCSGLGGAASCSTQGQCRSLDACAAAPANDGVDDSSSSTTLYIIIGAVLGALLLAALAALVLRARRRPTSVAASQSSETDDPIYGQSSFSNL